jgi:hypothetical protein
VCINFTLTNELHTLARCTETLKDSEVYTNFTLTNALDTSNVYINFTLTNELHTLARCT